MEFLIIIFIIFSLLSSLSKQAKKTNKVRKRRKKEVLFDPWSFKEGFPEDGLEREDEDTASIMLEEERDPVFPIEEVGEIKERERERLVEDIIPLEESKKFIVTPYEETKELIEPSYFVDEEKEKITITATVPLYLEKELTQLLRGGQLPLAIVLAEILGPPRALKPARKRSYTIYQDRQDK